ncbi:hypothetical protein VTL71DRAFT_13110 [Oculimacula yallundae]|uniref:Phosphate transporter n=1 Tax=Oculimacula yallundae TaxID=86028 RepID=A0ABR4CPX0_9HELO
MPVIESVSWIIAVLTVAFCGSSLGNSNGANDVSNSYATAIASGTLSFKQAGALAIITEFIGAVALGGKVTEKIKSGVINIHHFDRSPAVLVLVMGCVEFGTAAWLTIATSFGLPVSTTQTVVACLSGVGLASGASLKWGWKGKGLSTIAAAWVISPLLALIVAGIIQSLINIAVLNRKNPYECAKRLMPCFFAATCTLFPVFILTELLGKQSVQHFGIARFATPIVATFFGMLFLAYFFGLPYCIRLLDDNKQDARLRLIHLPMGPLLLRKDPPYYLPSKTLANISPTETKAIARPTLSPNQSGHTSRAESGDLPPAIPCEALVAACVTPMTAREKYLDPTSDLPFYKPARAWSWAKYVFLHGVSQDCVTFDSAQVTEAHQHSRMHDQKVERIWKPLLMLAAALMSIAHGSNDVANAVGPWVAAYQTWKNGAILDDAESPVWIIVVAAILIGVGFWFFGYKIVRSLGNKITHISPTRGYVINVASSITVLLASRFGLPVSTTQCQLGATIGVGLCSLSTKAVNWKQIGFIILGWIITIPIAGLIAGLLMGMGLNTPHL